MFWRLSGKVLVLVVCLLYSLVLQRDIDEIHLADADGSLDRAIVEGRELFQMRTFSDNLLGFTAPLNAYFLANLAAAESFTNFVTIGYALLSLVGIYIFLLVDGWIAMAVFLGWLMRESCQLLVTMPIPPGSLWVGSSVASLFFDWSTRTDFYFSGHIFYGLILSAYVVCHHPHWYVCASVSIFMGLSLFWTVALRINYTIDMVTAILAATVVYSVVPTTRKLATSMYELYSTKSIIKT